MGGRTAGAVQESSTDIHTRACFQSHNSPPPPLLRQTYLTLRRCRCSRGRSSILRGAKQPRVRRLGQTLVQERDTHNPPGLCPSSAAGAGEAMSSPGSSGGRLAGTWGEGPCREGYCRKGRRGRREGGGELQLGGMIDQVIMTLRRRREGGDD